MDWVAIPKKYNPLKAGSIDGIDDNPHDKAISRAMCAKYKPNKDVVGIPEHTIFVGRLSPNTDEDTLGYVFSEYGEIKRLRLVRDIVTGFSRCFAFIEYCDEDTAFKAQRDAHGSIIDDKEVYVDFECERTLKGWVPRRLGGGIGGKKESGQLRFGGKSRPFKKPFDVNNIQKTEGDSFKDRLRAVERGGQEGRYGARLDAVERGGQEGRHGARLNAVERDDQEGSYGARMDYRERYSYQRQQGHYNEYNRRNDKYRRSPDRKRSISRDRDSNPRYTRRRSRSSERR